MSEAAATAATTAAVQQPFTHLFVLDFEAQCLGDGLAPPVPQEIIELPIVVIDVQTRTIVDEFHTFVKPTVHPELFPFCKQLTHITQEQVDGGIELDEALANANEFLARFCDDAAGTSGLVVTCGHWDLRSCLPRECRYKGFRVPKVFKRWCNVKLLFQSHFRFHKQVDMLGMLQQLDIPLVGHHHSGIDDARNIAKIVVRLLEAGVVIDVNGRE